MGVNQSSAKVLAIKSNNDKQFQVPIVLPAHRVHNLSSLSTIASESTNPDKHSVEKVSNIENEDELMFHSLLETYECGSILGKGSSAKVFEVIHKFTGIKYACKVVQKNHSINDENTMKTETDIMKRMKHDNIIGLHELYETSTTQWFILELANSTTLHATLANAQYNYSEQLISTVFIQILYGIQYLHSIGIVHRDIKQDNILCSIIQQANGEYKIVPKIADFGLSAILKKVPKTTKQTKEYKKLKAVWGTKAYFAPELYKKAYGPQIDVWSLGCVLYELLVGESPFPVRERPVSIVDRYLFNQGKKLKRSYELRAGWNELSPSVQSLLHGMLKINPMHRYSIEECIAHPWFEANRSTTDSSNLSATVNNSGSVNSTTSDAVQYGSFVHTTQFRNPTVLKHGQAAAVKWANYKAQHRQRLTAAAMKTIHKSTAETRGAALQC